MRCFVSENWMWICFGGSLMLFCCCFPSWPLISAEVRFPCALSGQARPRDQNRAGSGFTPGSTAAGALPSAALAPELCQRGRLWPQAELDRGANFSSFSRRLFCCGWLQVGSAGTMCRSTQCRLRALEYRTSLAPQCRAVPGNRLLLVAERAGTGGGLQHGENCSLGAVHAASFPLRSLSCVARPSSLENMYDLATTWCFDTGGVSSDPEYFHPFAYHLSSPGDSHQASVETAIGI